MELTVADRRTAEREEQILVVHDWRRTQLLRAGFEPEDAAVLARRLEIDLHRAVGLVRQGCPPRTVLKILL